jgi:hypothetical protein
VPKLIKVLIPVNIMHMFQHPSLKAAFCCPVLSLVFVCRWRRAKAHQGADPSNFNVHQYPSLKAASCLLWAVTLFCAAGGGVPKLMKVLIPTDKVPFSKIMVAVRSNTIDQGGDGSVTLVLERVDVTSSSNGGSNGSSSSSSGVQQLAMVADAEGSEGEALFDPRIFNSTFE